MSAYDKAVDITLDGYKANIGENALSDTSPFNKSNSKNIVNKLSNSQDFEKATVFNIVVDNLDNKRRSPTKLIESISQRFKTGNNIIEKNIKSFSHSIDQNSQTKEFNKRRDIKFPDNLARGE